jgi:hypothetical protein
MHWGVFAISAAHLYLPKLPWRAPIPVRLVKEWILMLLIKNNSSENCLYIDIWCLFFIKKMSQNVWATIMPFGPVTLIFYWPKKSFSGRPKAGPHFRYWGISQYHYYCSRIVPIILPMYTFNYGNQLSALSNSELSPFIVEQLKISKCRNVPISLYYCSSINYDFTDVHFHYCNQLSALSKTEWSPFIVEHLKISKWRCIQMSLLSGCNNDFN